MGVCVGARKNARRFFLALLIAVACMVVVFPGCRSTGIPLPTLLLRSIKPDAMMRSKLLPGLYCIVICGGQKKRPTRKFAFMKTGAMAGSGSGEIPARINTITLRSSTG